MHDAHVVTQVVTYHVTMVPLNRESIWKHGQRPQSPNISFYMSRITSYLHFKTYFKKIYALVIKIDLFFVEHPNGVMRLIHSRDVASNDAQTAWVQLGH